MPAKPELQAHEKAVKEVCTQLPLMQGLEEHGLTSGREERSSKMPPNIQLQHELWA